MWYMNAGTTLFLLFCHKSRVWHTDGQTDRFSSLVRVYIPCSAVKMSALFCCMVLNEWSVTLPGNRNDAAVRPMPSTIPRVSVGGRSPRRTTTSHLQLFCHKSQRHATITVQVPSIAWLLINCSVCTSAATLTANISLLKTALLWPVF